MSIQKHKHIQFKDFSPSESDVKNVSTTLGKIQELLPEDTSVHSVLSVKGKKYIGDMKFKSKIGHFIAKANGKDMNQLMSKLRGKILKQWRARKTAMQAKKVDATLNVKHT